MRITTKGRYAIRAMTNLAINGNSKPKAIKVIAAEEDISPEFLEQIFFKLKKNGIIDSVRGPGGGFILNRPPESVNMREIFIAVDEGLDLTPCTSCSDDGTQSICSKQDSCLVHDIWQGASDYINNFFQNITLKTIMDKNKTAQLQDLLEGKNLGI